MQVLSDLDNTMLGMYILRRLHEISGAVCIPFRAVSVAPSHTPLSIKRGSSSDQANILSYARAP